MRLAVVTPTYNDAAFLPECLASVQDAAHFAGIQVEHAVVDDASTDGTAKLLAGHTLTRRLPRNRGCSAALNTAVELTTAPWLLVLASDDLVTPNAFIDWRSVVEQHPDVNVVYSDLECFGAYVGPYAPPAFRHSLLRERSILPGASFLRRPLFDAVGGFDERLPSAQDWDFWVRVDLVVGLTPHKVPRSLIRYRYHHTPRLHDQSVANIDRIQRHIRSRTRENAVLRQTVAA